MILLDTVERYVRGLMLPDERVKFEELRRTSAEVDQLVVEHSILLQQLDKFAEKKTFKSALQQIHGTLRESGELSSQPPGKVMSFIKKYRRVISVAATIAGITALSISGLVSYLTPKGSVSEIKQLSQEIREVKNSQQHAINEINRLKITSTNRPAVPGKLGGTGFMIDPKGYLVTSAHVVRTADSIYVENAKGEYFKARRVYVNDNTDVAILKIEDPRFQVTKQLPYSIKRNSAELGEKIFTLGYPRTEIVYNEGYLSAKTGFNGDTMTCQIAISANPGNSGGPVFNDAGEVIGILSGKQITAEGVVFSSKAANIYQAIEEVKKALNNDLKITSGNSHVRGLDRVQQIKKIKGSIYVVKSY